MKGRKEEAVAVDEEARGQVLESCRKGQFGF